MEKIQHMEYGGERPLYCARELSLEDVTIHAGESALKETAGIQCSRCRFEGKYPLWRCDGFSLKECVFAPGARAAMWYSRGLLMEDCLVEAPKMFRKMEDMELRNVRMTDAQETLWDCRDVTIDGLKADGADYIIMHCQDVELRNSLINGNYAFQSSRGAVVRNCVLNTKDAFWETENVTVYDSEINGEYLGWHSRGLHLVRCRISGTQPLCYAEDLVLEDCTFTPDADLAFEYSSVQATILGHITSIKNPRTGFIRASSIGHLILDSNIKPPADCRILIG